MGTQQQSRNIIESNNNTPAARSPIIYPKLSIIGIRVDSILLLIVGFTIIAIQVSVLLVYSNGFGEAASGEKDTKPWWAPLYNWWCVSSGIVNLLIGFYGCFINSNRSQTWRLGWGLILSLLALIASLGAALLASVQTVRLSAVFDAGNNNTKSIQDQPSHPCGLEVKENSLTDGDCLVWFGLEATVASLSALSVILCAVMALLIIIGLCSSTPASSSGTSSNTHEIKHTLVHRQQYNQHDIKGATGLAPLPASIGVAVAEPPKQEVEQRPPEPEKQQDEVEAYASRLREMSEEELERHLQLRLQRAFVLELRRELDRRQRRRNMNSMQSETISEDPGQRESQANLVRSPAV